MASRISSAGLVSEMACFSSQIPAVCVAARPQVSHTVTYIFQENALYYKKMNLTRDSQLQAKHTEVSKRVRELTDQLNRLLDAHMLPKGVSPRCVSCRLAV